MVGLARTVPGRRRRLPEANVWQVWLTPVFISARFLNANRDPLRLKTLLETRRRTMTGETRYRALFLGAGPQMHCGVGQFTRLLQETIEKLEPGSSTTLTLTRDEGSLAEIWRAVGSAQSVVCNFPIVAWKRVMFAPLAGDGDRPAAPAQGRPDPARMGRAALAAPHHLHAGAAAGRHHRHVLAAGAARTGRAIPCSAGPPKRACWRRCRRTSKPRLGIQDSKLRHRLIAAKGDGRLLIGHFGSIYPGQAAQCAARDRRHPEATRAQAADRLYRLLHPRRRQGRGGVSCPRQRTRHRRRRDRLRLRRLRSRGVRPVQRDRRVLLSAR